MKHEPSAEIEKLEDVFTDDVRRLFYELGMAATTMGKKFEANLMFFNLLEADASSAYPLLGLGYCRMMAGSFGEADALLRDPRVVNSPLAEAALGLRALALHLEGREGDKQELLRQSPSSTTSATQELMATLEKTSNEL